MDNLAVEKSKVTTEATSFDRVTFHESYIQEKFIDIIEQNKLQHTNPSLTDLNTGDLELIIGSHLEFKELKLTPIEEKTKPGESIWGDFDHEYQYMYTQVFWNTIDQEKVEYSGILAIDENFKIIEGDSISTVKIIW